MVSKDYWEESGIEKPQQVVVCAAIRFGDLIIAGARHYDSVMRSQLNHLDPSIITKSSQGEQGFIDQFGEFLTRKEAMKIVKESGQPFDIDRNGGDVALFSEGLY